MFLYKPESLEENLSNVRYLKSIFWKDINAFGCSYRRTWQIYNNPIYYNQAVYYGFINPYMNTYEDEIRHLAYEIFGFTSNVFETLSYALDCWRIHNGSLQKNRKITDKEYDQAINLLAKKKKIVGKDKETLLKFRPQRNLYTHYGKIQFCDYIFNNSGVLYNLIDVVEKLLGQMEINETLLLEFNRQQGNYIEQMKEVLEEFAINNFNVA